MFVIIDGIDGSGKSTIMNFWAEYLAGQGKRVFFLKEFWTTHHTHPTIEDLKNFDVIISAEPTTVWTGAAIRQEMIRSDADYSARAIADVYALDRLVLYKRLILPLLKQEKTILQDRSVSTSLCYQPIQDGALSMADIAAIEGNAFALEHNPDHLIIADLPAETALQRLGKRMDKQDDALFEKQDFLNKARTRFLDPEYQNYFSSRGTDVHILNVDVELDIMKQKALVLLKELL